MNPIEEAREFVRSQVIQPALGHAELSKKAIDEARNANRLLDRFERVGDLMVYLDRFKQNREGEIYKELRKFDLKTFEDIVDEFRARFGPWEGSRLTTSDFIVGRPYDISTIHIFVGSYDLRAGGMFAIGNDPDFKYAVIKATFSGGKYPNQWIEPHQRLKYYLKSRENKDAGKATFGENFKENRAILANPNLPVLVFTREREASPFVYEGIFFNKEMRVEADESKWFDLYKAPHDDVEEVVDAAKLEDEIQRGIEVSAKKTSTELQDRLRSAPKKPKQIVVMSTAYERNPDVIEFVRRRANGICEECKQPAPFLRKKDGKPYLEVHHRIRLADHGEDTVENAIALCPNCHRKSHYGI